MYCALCELPSMIMLILLCLFVYYKREVLEFGESVEKGGLEEVLKKKLYTKGNQGNKFRLECKS